MVGFDGATGLYADLATGSVPIMRSSFPISATISTAKVAARWGRSASTIPATTARSDLNPALIALGDMAVQKIVTAIKQSPAWRFGNNAIVVVWDENDYSAAPNVNKVVLVVDTNYGGHGKTSATYYNHFSLLKSVEGGLACRASIMPAMPTSR